MTMNQGCRNCRGCLNTPIRGNYDGLVVLTVVTKDILPNGSIGVVGVPHITKRSVDKWLDHEQVNNEHMT